VVLDAVDFEPTGIVDFAKVGRLVVRWLALTEEMDGAKAGGERAPVVAPLAVLVSCALWRVMQLYLAIPLAPWWVRRSGVAAPRLRWALPTASPMRWVPDVGPLSDRYGRKPILVPGIVVLAIITAHTGPRHRRARVRSRPQRDGQHLTREEHRRS
jgi:hypothetical protein